MRERFITGFEWWNCGELDLMQDQYAEDAEFDVSAVFTDTRPFCGHGSMRRYWDEMAEAWKGMRMEPLEVFDVSHGRFVVDLRLWGKGAHSGAETEQRFGCLYTVRAADEKVVRFQLFPSVEAAMDSAASSAHAG